MRGLSLVAASGDHSSSRCAGLSLSRPVLLQSTGSRRAGSVVVAHGPSCSATCGIFPDQGSNPCPLHWQADSHPLCHQGSPLLPSFRQLHNSIFPQLFFFFLIFGCIGSSLLHAGATLHCGAWVSHCGGFSFCRARALGTAFSSCGLWAQ